MRSPLPQRHDDTKTGWDDGFTGRASSQGRDQADHGLILKWPLCRRAVGAPAQAGTVFEVEVLCSQGLASQAGPESCARAGNRPGEALDRGTCRLGMEPRKTRNSGAPTLSTEAEGHTGVSALGERAWVRPALMPGFARSETSHMHGSTVSGSRESPCLPRRKVRGRIGKSKDARR